MTTADFAPRSPNMLDDIINANSKYAESFDKPMTLGAKKKLSIVTCMDSRLLIDKMLPGVDIGDVEIIRNAGGRVTMDVVRSLFVAQEVPELATRAVLLLHHTDCGAMAAMRHHDQLVGRMRQLLSEWGVTTWAVQALASAWGLLLPRFVRKKVLNAVMRPFADPAASVREDVWLLRNAPLMPKDIPIYGMVYDVQTGRMHHVLTSPAGKA
ncbi:hypothetical protein OEZ85_003213 [Tetradesmus obliquus]|uniref:Carbonic anhydrase n=1 Tax=Tetradesmus obliquus TaxID=3088 RepID=A0ABY8U270_TETOB|nr:hypothetical protein OEZ85_003213 [Tetradesmus obliquus]